MLGVIPSRHHDALSHRPPGQSINLTCWRPKHEQIHPMLWGADSTASLLARSRGVRRSGQAPQHTQGTRLRVFLSSLA